MSVSLLSRVYYRDSSLKSAMHNLMQGMLDIPYLQKTFVVNPINPKEREFVLEDHRSPTKKDYVMVALKVAFFYVVGFKALVAIMAADVILRQFHTYKITTIEEMLNDGINITKVHTDKLTSLMDKIIRGKADDQLVWLATGNNRVFKLANDPNLVFKIDKLTNLLKQPKAVMKIPLLGKWCALKKT